MPRKGLGVLSVYSSRPAAFDAAAELVLPVLAARAAIAIAYADTVANLRRAIESRQVIGQAVGILMERHRLSPKHAFDRPVTAPQHSHIKLRELAIRISETGEEPYAAAQHDPEPTTCAERTTTAAGSRRVRTGSGAPPRRAPRPRSPGPATAATGR
jgi:ANTAR domain